MQPKSKYLNSPSVLSRNECLLEENESLSSTISLANKHQTPKKHSTTKHELQLATATAPAIDFRLNVKIEMSSGKCVLHANKPNNKTSQGQNPSGSPLPGYFGSHEYNRATTGNYSSFSNSYMEQEMRNTNFIFPAIGVKAFMNQRIKRLRIV